MLEAMGAAAVTAAALVLLCAGLGRALRGLADAGSVLGVGLGFYVGCWMLDLRPHWPPLEVQDRFLLLLFPAVMALELIPAPLSRVRWPIWLLRGAVALGAAPVLLYNSSYLADLAGPGTREWTPAQTWLILGSMAAALIVVWVLLASLMRSASPQASLSPGQENTRA